VLTDRDLFGYFDGYGDMEYDHVYISSMHLIHTKKKTDYREGTFRCFAANLSGPFTEADSLMCQRPWVRDRDMCRRGYSLDVPDSGHWTGRILSDELFPVTKLGLTEQDLEDVKARWQTKEVREFVELISRRGSTFRCFGNKPQFIAAQEFVNSPRDDWEHGVFQDYRNWPIRYATADDTDEQANAEDDKNNGASGTAYGQANEVASTVDDGESHGASEGKTDEAIEVADDETDEVAVAYNDGGV